MTALAPTLAVAAAEFGWGSAGKLSAVLAALRAGDPRPRRVVLLGSGLGRPLLAGHGIDAVHEVSTPGAVAEVLAEEEVDAALVVLDPAIANACTAAGVPTTYVDSLPFLWTRGDLPGFPVAVAAYCAQRCLELPAGSEEVLGHVQRLHWVDPVVEHAAAGGPGVPAGRWRGAGGRALVNLGGLRSPHAADWAAYPRLVVPAVLTALRDTGFEEAHVAGNVPAELAAELVRSAPERLRVSAGPLARADFLARLDGGCDVLVTSPGLTTLLEASSRGVPVVALPPQNLSQVFNARFHRAAVGDRFGVRWPAGVFTDEEAVAASAGGEEAALEVVYGGISRARPAAVRPALRTALADALRAVAAGGTDWGALAARLGTSGAAQVAEIVLATGGREHRHRAVDAQARG
ncbi:hydroxymethylcytosylglucuronate/cytosylglucuronate synthase [Lentzea sp. NPDC042327]|uniref:hydroxymethylcytosylglucuronate/cytosylglucurona te synthase n=1 Tax=Lentzea sp. NPDC042327 TaxID=3154801 RepID=UPI0033C0F788